MATYKKFTGAELEAYRKGKAAAAKKNGYPKKKYDNKKYKKTYPRKKPGAISAIGEFGGGLAGEALGGPVGMAIGNFLGGKLGHLVENITGFGDYKIASNSIMKGGMTPPQIVNSVEKGGVIVRHREYIGEVSASTTFNAVGYALNPGLPGSFPWLAGIAQNYDQYRWRGVLYEFKSTSSDAVLSSATSSALGSVSMATEYDVVDDPYASKREMLNSLFANSTKPSCNLIHPIECKRSQTPMNLQYVRTGDYPANTDARMYDLGKFYIATEGMQGTGGVLGELWVTYEVEFFKQQIPDLDVAPVYTDMWTMTGITGGTGALEWLGNNRTQAVGVSMTGTTDSGSYYFPSDVNSGDFIMIYSAIGGVIPGSIPLSPPSLLESNCTATIIGTAPSTASANRNYITYIRIRITAANAAIGFLAGNLPETPVAAKLWVCKINADIV